ncbi:ABC transporter permease [Kitasatospora sp. MMS16-BH015]|uniref:ABC transporter permease n=1 Tax=Kitasatospora sp. MMS16-BH015 TaxID=2018025 RepID=UPI000CA11E12|nr:ABC transporter permease [Kitasatospora sp. MMS16-BH015]AUG76486.1 ABC transporter permease [Kitasatospora sp. MMS16-BH015]
MNTAPLHPTPLHTASRFHHLLAAEWTKFWSVRSVSLVLGLTTLGVLAANLRSAQYMADNSRVGDAFNPQAAFDTAFTLLGSDLLLLVTAGVGAMVSVSEYATGLVRTTFVAVPRRRAVLTAKAVVLAAVMTGYGLLLAGLSFWLTQALLAGKHLGLSVAAPGAPRFLAATALYAPVCALVGFCLGVLLRHGAATVVAGVLVLFVLPSLFTDTHAWTAAVGHAMPLNAWRFLTRIDLGDQLPLHHPPTVPGAWAAYAGWALAATGLSVLVADRRDA